MFYSVLRPSELASGFGGKGKGGTWGMHWYNPRTRTVENTPAPSTDEEALQMLRGDINSGAFMSEYERLRSEEGMGVEEASSKLRRTLLLRRRWVNKDKRRTGLTIGRAESRD